MLELVLCVRREGRGGEGSISRLTGQEAVKLDQELQVDIVALGGLAVSAAHVVAVEIDTYKQTRVSSSAFGSGMLRRDWQHSRTGVEKE